MTKEKWMKVCKINLDLISLIGKNGRDPALWCTQKEILLESIKDIDEATEVYELENNTKKVK